MSRLHVVWDWNGTLLDDLPIVIEAVNTSIGRLGFSPITADIYRDHYTRPVRHFYDRLFERVVTDEEWETLNKAFHDAYFALAHGADLAPGAEEAMNRIASHGWTQSLLSMSPQEWLERIVDRLELTSRLTAVDGLRGPTGGLKADHLVSHLGRLGLEGSEVVIIGDTPDDVAAARQVGAPAILFHGGSHHLDLLRSQGVPIAESIVEAVSLALEA